MNGGGFAERLDLTLKALSISRGRLAADLGVDKSVVARWLSGSTAPTGHNLSRVTALVATHRPGFTMLDWDGALPELAVKLGARDAAAEPIASLGDWPPVRALEAAAAATATRGEAYEGFWKSTRLANDPPGRFMHDRILIRRAPGGLLETRMGVLEMRFEGVAFINQTQLFGMTVDADSGIFVFTIFNTVPRQRAEAMDGISLTCTQASGGAPVAAAVYMERTGLLTGDARADDATFEASLGGNPLAPDGSISDALRAHLFRDVGPTPFAAGGDALLTMAFSRSMARAIDPRAAKSA
jgi:transcriptional regulator with XRE-family HTH domain